MILFNVYVNTNKTNTFIKYLYLICVYNMKVF